MTTITVPKRQVIIPDRRVALSDEMQEHQVRLGLFTMQGGIPLAIPVDSLSDRTRFGGKPFWKLHPKYGTHRVGVRFTPHGTSLHKKILTFLRDRVHPQIPYLYYLLVLGHDLHTSIRGELYARHWHQGWADPFNPEWTCGALDPNFETNPIYRGQDMLGFVENLGLLSAGKVSDAFVSEIIDELVSATASEFADFDFHEVGTSSQVENNNDTALIVSSGIARATGTPTDSDPIYQNVGTITADATETWEEHGLFNNSAGAALMDRSLTGGHSVASGNQVEYTYQLTVNPEA